MGDVLVRAHARSRSTRLAATLAFAAAVACEPAPLTVAVVQYNDQATQVVEAFTDELQRLVTSRALTFVHVNGREDLRVLTAETHRIAQDEPSLMVGMGSFAATAVQQAVEGTMIPAAVGFVSYDVAVALVDATRAHGGQMTGVATLGLNLAAKALETLVDTDPAIQRVLFLHSTAPAWVAIVPELLDVAESHDVKLVAKQVATAEEAAQTFDQVQSGEVDAILLPGDQTILEARDAVHALSRRAAVPIISLTSNPVGGASMTFAQDALESAHQLAGLALKVLSGTPATDLPVEIPHRVLLRLYADNALEVGYTFTDQMVAAADEIIGDLARSESGRH